MGPDETASDLKISSGSGHPSVGVVTLNLTVSQQMRRDINKEKHRSGLSSMAASKFTLLPRPTQSSKPPQSWT